MMNSEQLLIQNISSVLQAYHDSFSSKAYSKENNDSDILMNIFGITPELKRENRQYWGRELGMIWQIIINHIFSHYHDSYGKAIRIGDDEPCDLVAGTDAIDTKYRIGSGDSGTLKKFKAYGKLLRDKGYRPVLLILRDDNLPAAITACNHGGWTVLTGQASVQYIFDNTGINVIELLMKFGNQYNINR
jgi:hypothetical protein